MGVIKQGILGGFSGKVANVVGSSWKGIAVIKSLPLSVSNPRTAAQTGQRTKFTAIVDLAVAVLTIIVKPLWDRFAQSQSGYNAFIQANIAQFSSAGVPTYANLKTSSGSLNGADIDEVDCDAPLVAVVINFADNTGVGNALATDEVYAMVMNETNGDVAATGAVTTREDGTVTVTLPNPTTGGDVLHCYLSFRKADGTLVSPTSYLSHTA